MSEVVKRGRDQSRCLRLLGGLNRFLRVWVGLRRGEHAGDESPMGLPERVTIILIAAGELGLAYELRLVCEVFPVP